MKRSLGPRFGKNYEEDVNTSEMTMTGESFLCDCTHHYRDHTDEPVDRNKSCLKCGCNGFTSLYIKDLELFNKTIGVPYS